MQLQDFLNKVREKEENKLKLIKLAFSEVLKILK